mmetsp:Transcript_24659/g.37472  ORF Transcript_24659/g.37472 Transcript_24659/m.37472 type:complete len:376 (-) Transcript_24659:335-1462(-)
MVRQVQGGAAPTPGSRAAEADRDQLLPFFGTTKTAQALVEKLQEDGYVVLPGVISREEVDVEYDRLWGFVETVAPTVKRDDPYSWYPASRHDLDPWPHAQRDMFQLHQAGWLFSDLREKMADRVYAQLYGSNELHVSKDGFTFFRPTDKQIETTPNDHFDQGLGYLGIHCVQGSVALTDQEEGDGCFQCWPGSHKYREKLLGSVSPGKAYKDFIMLNEKDKAMLRQKGFEPRRIPVSKGDVILWRSDLCHCGAPPLGARPGFRAVVYICCLPAALTPETVYPDKLRAYQQLETGAHWPSREEWFQPKPKHLAIDPQPYFRTPPELPLRQQQLYGIARYQQAEGVSEEQTSASASRTTATAPRARRWVPRTSVEKT